ncbi:MAG: cyclic nucleotide-binding domain-containing protein, partial [Bacteroidota bacterium]
MQEGDALAYYYQILMGEIKLVNYNDKGKEMIQGIFSQGQGFGSPAIIGDFPSCSNAEATKASQLICLEKRQFLRMLKENA